MVPVGGAVINGTEIGHNIIQEMEMPMEERPSAFCINPGEKILRLKQCFTKKWDLRGNFAKNNQRRPKVLPEKINVLY